MTIDPLSATPLATLIAQSLPQEADPQLASPEQAIAIACHAGFLSVGFRFIGLTKDSRLPTSSTADAPTPLPSAWNAHSTLEFAYTHPQSSMTFILKVFSLGAKTLVSAIGIEHNKTFSFDLSSADYVSPSSLPSSPAKATSPEDAHHKVQTIYISPSRLTDLGSSLKLNIIQNLVPSLQKEGYEETPQSSATRSANDNQPPVNPRAPPYQPPPSFPSDPDPARPHPLADPSVAPRRPPVAPGELPPPGFEDPYDLHRPPRGERGIGGPQAPGYGERDLYPPGMGPNDPLRIGSGGGGIRGGGMAMGFDDLDDTLRAPPGARYDPPGPSGDPYDPLMDGQRRGGGPRGGPGGPRFGGAGGAPPNPFGGFGGGDFI